MHNATDCPARSASNDVSVDGPYLWGWVTMVCNDCLNPNAVEWQAGVQVRDEYEALVKRLLLPIGEADYYYGGRSAEDAMAWCADWHKRLADWLVSLGYDDETDD